MYTRNVVRLYNMAHRINAAGILTFGKYCVTGARANQAIKNIDSEQSLGYNIITDR